MNENMIFNNSFGSVTDKRVIVTNKNRSEDIPIKQVTSISFERKQNKLLAAVYLIAALVMVFLILNFRNVGGAEMLIVLVLSIFFILAGISYYVGNYIIKMTIAGKEGKPIKVEMSKVKEGNEFYQAIRKQIIID